MLDDETLARVLAADPAADPGVWKDAGLDHLDPTTLLMVQDELRQRTAREISTALDEASLRLPEDWKVPTAEKLAEPRDQYRWFIEGLVHEGFHVELSGLPKTGKSTWVQNFVQATEHKRRMLGRWPIHLPEGRKIGVVDFENDEDIWLDDISTLKVESSDRFQYLNLRGVRAPLTGELRDYLLRWGEHYGICFPIIDTMAATFLGDDDNKGAQLNRWAHTHAELMAAGADYDCFEMGSMVLKHSPESAPRRSSGAPTLRGYWDAMLNLHYHTAPDGMPIDFEIRPSRGKIEPGVFTTSYLDGRVWVASEGEEATERVMDFGKLTPADHGLLAVARNPNVESARSMRDKVRGVGPDERDDALKSARAAGYITWTGRPRRYSVTERGQARLAEIAET